MRRESAASPSIVNWAGAIVATFFGVAFYNVIIGVFGETASKTALVLFWVLVTSVARRLQPEREE